MITKRCFVISPIGKKGTPVRERADRVLELVIRPAVSSCGYEATRADEMNDPGIITSHMIQRIIDDQLVVADLTGHNPNVFYEIAVRHSVQKPIIQIVESKKEIPFDLAGMRAIQFSHKTTRDIKTAQKRIVGQIQEYEKSTLLAHNPISLTLAQLGIQQNWMGKVRDIIEGRRLFEYMGYYPIDLAPITNKPSLNPKKYIHSLEHFVNETYDKLAAVDLVFLRQDNRDDGDILKNKRSIALYNNLVDKYQLSEFESNFITEKQRIFRNYIRIVNDIGETFKDCHIEILLHNVMNPLRSIIAIANSGGISDRRLGDPSTRFVVEFVKHQGRFLQKKDFDGRFVGYSKELFEDKNVKATTIPIFHPRYGLIRIICINIDVDTINNLDSAGIAEFLKQYLETSGITPQFEKR